MALFKKYTIKDSSFIQTVTTNKNILFDYPAPLYGTEHTHPSFSKPQKPLKFIVKNIPEPEVIFLSSSNALGVFFLKGNPRIYCTKPVFEQILIKLEIFQKMAVTYEEPEFDIQSIQTKASLLNKEVAISYHPETEEDFKMFFEGQYLNALNDEELQKTDDNRTLENKPETIEETVITTPESYDLRIVAISEANIVKFKRNCTLIAFNQKIYIDDLLITPLSPGTHMGWANYQITFPSSKTLLYLASYSSKRRFTIDASPITSDFLIINRQDIFGDNGILNFTKFVENLRDELIGFRAQNFYTNKHYLASPSKRILEEGIIPAIGSINVNSSFVYGTNNLRILESASKSSKTVVIPTQIETFFIEVIFHLLSILDNSNIAIYVVSTAFDKLDLLINIQSEWLNRGFCSISEPFPIKQYKNLKVVSSFNEIDKSNADDLIRVVFCEELYFKLFKDKIFPDQQTVLINEDRTEFGDITMQYKDAIRFNIKVESTKSEILKNYSGVLIEQDHFALDSDTSKRHIFLDGNMSIFNDMIYLSGELLNTDFYNKDSVRMSFIDSKSIIKELIDTEKYILIEGWFIFASRRVKFRILENSLIEIKHF